MTCFTHELHGTPEDDGSLRVWHVYYCYAADGTLLYVGYSGDPVDRLRFHRDGYSPWYYYCARVEISPEIRCRFDAQAFEVAEIGRLRPVFNILGNPDPQPWHEPTDHCLRFGQLPEITWVTAPTPVEQSA